MALSSGRRAAGPEMLANGEVRPKHWPVGLGKTKAHAPDALAENVEQFIACRPDAVRIATESGQRRDPVLHVQLVDDPGAPLRSRRQPHD